MPAQSKSQQRLFGMLHAYNKGEFKGSKSLRKKLQNMSKHISDESAVHFAETPHKGLPEKKAYTLHQVVNIQGNIRALALQKLAQSTNYTVQRGDTLSHIAQRNNTTVAALTRLNNISNPNLIRPGQRLTLAQPPVISPTLRRTTPATTTQIPTPSKPTSCAVPTLPDGMKPSPVTTTQPVQQQRGLNYVAGLLHKKFKNPNLVAGILANIDRENASKFDHTVWQGLANKKLDLDQKQTGGYGLFQFTGPTLSDYKNWLKVGKLNDSVESQIDFAYSKYGPSRAGWKKYTDPKANFSKEEYADWWHKKVETPSHVIPGHKDYSLDKIQKATDRHNNFMKNKIKLNNGVWQQQ